MCDTCNVGWNSCKSIFFAVNSAKYVCLYSFLTSVILACRMLEISFNSLKIPVFLLFNCTFSTIYLAILVKVGQMDTVAGHFLLCPVIVTDKF